MSKASILHSICPKIHHTSPSYHKSNASRNLRLLLRCFLQPCLHHNSSFLSSSLRLYRCQSLCGCLSVCWLWQSFVRNMKNFDKFTVETITMNFIKNDTRCSYPTMQQQYFLMHFGGKRNERGQKDTEAADTQAAAQDKDRREAGWENGKPPTPVLAPDWENECGKNERGTQSREVLESRGTFLTDRPGASVKFLGCLDCFRFFVKCKRKIAWENFLNFSANIWLWQNKQTMWKKQRSDIASNGKNIYFLKHYATTFALMWKYLTDTESPSPPPPSQIP